jgi:hypothetical protein
MTSQESAHGRLTRAIERGHIPAADMAARELGTLSLSDALALCLLYEREGDPPLRKGFQEVVGPCPNPAWTRPSTG